MDSAEQTQTQIIEQIRSICGGSPKSGDSLAMIGVDSVAMAELTLVLEKKFSIEIDDEILDVDTIDELTRYVMNKQAAVQ